MVGGQRHIFTISAENGLKSPTIAVKYFGHEDENSGCTGSAAYFLILLVFPTLHLLVQLNQIFLTSFGEEYFVDPSEDIGEGVVLFFLFEVWVRW